MTIAINVIIIFLILFIIYWFWLHKPKITQIAETGEVTVVIANGVYHPDEIVARVGKPITLHFILKDDAHCAKTVIFKDFNQSRELSKDKPESITLTPNKSGTYTFSCPMNMYSGHLIVQEAPVIDITIADGVYKPDLIESKVGEPISLRFTRKDPSKCAETVIFPDFKLSREISMTEPQIITLTPTQEGEYRFHCDMGMYQGKIIVTGKNTQ